MIVGIDGNEANIKERVGINKYAFEIICGISKIVNENKEPITIIVYLKDKPLSDMPKETARFKYKILRGGRVWIITKLAPYLLTNPDKLNVFFTPSHYLPPFLKIPSAMAIMDLGYLEFSEQFTKYDFWQLKYWTAWSIKISKCIMTISNATKEDIVRHYPSTKNKLTITHPGFDESLLSKRIENKDIASVKNKYTIVNNYILYLGTLKPSKNIEGLIEAWKKIETKFPDTVLVISGKKGWMYDNIFKKLSELGINNRVVFTDFIREEDKPILIKGAKVFIIPSFWEGFGLDVLAAFALKVPVIASSSGSLPEVVGKAGVIIDPHNINSIAEGIEKTLTLNKNEYNKLIKNGLSRLKEFSWQKASELTLGSLKKIANV